MPDSDGDGGSPEAAFSVLGHDLRMDIIRALWESEDAPVAFSALRERAAVDDSGQFNYHLGELVGTFVRRTEDGYELTYAGNQVVGAIVDGTYTKEASLAPLELEHDCPFCESALEGSYESAFFEIRCPDGACDQLEPLVGFPVPPGAIETRSREAVVDMAYHWHRAQFLRMRNGICSNCAGPMSTALTTDFEPPDHEVGVRYDCEQCMYWGQNKLPTHLVTHPAVVSFYHDHGVDLTSGWNALVPGDGQSTAVRNRDPWRVEVTMTIAGDDLELLVDGDPQVVDSQRT